MVSALPPLPFDAPASAGSGDAAWFAGESAVDRGLVNFSAPVNVTGPPDPVGGLSDYPRECIRIYGKFIFDSPMISIRTDADPDPWDVQPGPAPKAGGGDKTDSDGDMAMAMAIAMAWEAEA
eukprot:gene12630-biopygen36